MAALVYHPSEQQASLFWSKERERSPELEAAQPPAGFPAQINGPLAWTPYEIEAKQSEWLLHLSADDMEHLEAALTHWKAHGLNHAQISPDAFPLPAELVRKLQSLSATCYDGVGFAILRGLDPSRYTPSDNVAIYAGITAHAFPERGFIDYGGERVLSHVVNVADKAGNTKKTPAFTNGPLSFHTDNTEILSLYALSLAPRGGRTLISPSYTVYNDLSSTAPSVLHTLASPWTLDTFQDYARHPPRVSPFLHENPARPSRPWFRFSRYPMVGFAGRPRNPALPAPTQEQERALDAVQFMAARHSFALPMQKGDMLFVNDMAIMHAREQFEEDEGVDLQRHLLKLYLRDPQRAWPVPETSMKLWEMVYARGAHTPGSKQEEWSAKFIAGGSTRAAGPDPEPNPEPNPDPDPNPDPLTNG